MPLKMEQFYVFSTVKNIPYNPSFEMANNSRGKFSLKGFALLYLFRAVSILRKKVRGY